MHLTELQLLSADIANRYRQSNQDKGYQSWTALTYCAGLSGDLGDLTKLVMAKEKYRDSSGDIDTKIRHELADCLWSLLMVAKKLDIPLEEAFRETMQELQQRLA